MLESAEGTRKLFSAHFLLDTGADRTFVPASAYRREGFVYDEFLHFPPSYPVGVGGAVEVRLVPASILLMGDDGEMTQLAAVMEMAKPNADLDLLPPLLGRDVTDLFRIIIDRQAGIVALTESKAEL